MRILITGGAGFIGSNLANRLCDSNAIVVVDNLVEGYVKNIDTENVDFIRGDICNAKLMENIFRKNDFDVVFHMAADFANQKSVENPVKDMEVNALGTLSVLELLRKHDISRFVYAGSSSSYGNLEDKSFREDTIPKPSTPYAVSKLAGDNYTIAYNRLYGLETCSLRYFNVYGPGEFPGKYRNVIPNFFDLAMNGKSLKITGTGKEVRDFTYIDDAIDVTIEASRRKQAVGEIINIGGGEGVEILTLAEKINSITGNDKIEFVPRRRWDTVARRVANIEKARKILDYNPKIDLDEGLRRTHEWFKFL